MQSILQFFLFTRSFPPPPPPTHTYNLLGYNMTSINPQGNNKFHHIISHCFEIQCSTFSCLKGRSNPYPLQVLNTTCLTKKQYTALNIALMSHQGVTVGIPDRFRDLAFGATTSGRKSYKKPWFRKQSPNLCALESWTFTFGLLVKWPVVGRTSPWNLNAKTWKGMISYIDVGFLLSVPKPCVYHILVYSPCETLVIH